MKLLIKAFQQRIESIKNCCRVALHLAGKKILKKKKCSGFKQVGKKINTKKTGIFSLKKRTLICECHYKKVYKKRRVYCTVSLKINICSNSSCCNIPLGINIKCKMFFYWPVKISKEGKYFHFILFFTKDNFSILF